MRTEQKALAGFFVSMGLAHFVAPKLFEAIIPEPLPAKRELNLIAGAAEIAGGLAVLHPRTRRAAGTGLQALLIAVFPANVNMLVNADKFRPMPVPLLWARLPMQPMAMWWVHRATRRA